MREKMVCGPMDNLFQPKVSVIVPTHNSSRTIEKCLESILKQDYPNLELVVVDDASTDQTLAKVSRYGVRVISKTKNCGAAHSRNIGAQKADSEILIFADSDVAVPQHGVSRLIKAFAERENILAVNGVYSENTQDLNFISDFKNMDLAYRTSLCGDYIKYLGSFFFAIKKSTFLEAGGFSTDFSRGATVEDIEFGYRVTKGKNAIFLDKGCKVDHLKIYSFFSMLKTDFIRIIYMMKIIRDSNGRYKAGEHSQIPYFINLFLPGLILLSIITAIIFKWWWLSLLLASVFIVNNFGFEVFLVRKRGVIFAARSLFALFIEYVVVGFSILSSLFLLSPKYLNFRRQETKI